MQSYIGTKIIQAEPMNEVTFLEKFKKQIPRPGATRPGYHVLYSDGYHSWSPEETFEEAYRLISDAEKKLI